MTKTTATATATTASPTSEDAVKYPSLSPLYFCESNGDALHHHNETTTISLTSSDHHGAPNVTAFHPLNTMILPCELWNKCLIDYSDWGDVARLSCVQRRWSHLLWDAAHVNDEAKWQCANALLDGTHGLASHPTLALQLLSELAGPIHWNSLHAKLQKEEEEEATTMELTNDTAAAHQQQNDEEETSTVTVTTTQCDSFPYRAEAMRRIANLYLNGEAPPTFDTPASIAAAAAAAMTLPAATTENDVTSSANNTNNSTAPCAAAAAAAQIGLGWLQAAFEIGNDVTAAHDVAVLLEHGQDDDIPIDVVASGRWFYKAAKAGHVESMAELALLYELGIGGMTQSDEQALYWYRQAAARDHTTSKYSVGEALEAARGVPHSDVEEACRWYYKAALDGDDDGKNALRRLVDVATRIMLVRAPEELGALLGA